MKKSSLLKRLLAIVVSVVMMFGCVSVMSAQGADYITKYSRALSIEGVVLQTGSNYSISEYNNESTSIRNEKISKLAATLTSGGPLRIFNLSVPGLNSTNGTDITYVDLDVSASQEYVAYVYNNDKWDSSKINVTAIRNGVLALKVKKDGLVAICVTGNERVVQTDRIKEMVGANENYNGNINETKAFTLSSLVNSQNTNQILSRLPSQWPKFRPIIIANVTVTDVNENGVYIKLQNGENGIDSGCLKSDFIYGALYYNADTGVWEDTKVQVIKHEGGNLILRARANGVIAIGGVTTATNGTMSGGDITWSLSGDKRTLTINADDACPSGSPWSYYADCISTVVMNGTGIDELSEDLFADHTSLTSITIPNSVKRICYGAFNHCTSLRSLTIPYGVEIIENEAFRHCEALTSITIPKSVTEIYTAFNYCTGLTSISLPNSLDSLSRGAFDGCSNLRDIYFDGLQEEWLFLRGDELRTNAKIHFIGETNEPNQPAVVSVNGVSISQAAVSLAVGETLGLNASVSPSDASNKAVSWSSDNPKVATVDGNGNVTAVKAGVANIIVTTVEGGYKAKCKVTVGTKAVKISSIKVKPTSVKNFSVGSSVTLTATVKPDNADQEVEWSSSNPAIASVDSNGVVTGLKGGKVKITVKSTANPKKKKTINITVKGPVSVSDVKLKAKASVKAGKKVNLSASVKPAKATNKNVSFASDNENVAIILTQNNKKGKCTVKGVNPGVAHITVTTEDGGHSKTCTVTVK